MKINWSIFKQNKKSFFYGATLHVIFFSLLMFISLKDGHLGLFLIAFLELPSSIIFIIMGDILVNNAHFESAIIVPIMLSLIFLFGTITLGILAVLISHKIEKRKS